MSEIKYTVLIAEDDKDDAYFIQSAFEESDYFGNVFLVKDGIELLDFLEQEKNIRPDVIITDLNMPRMDGYEVLNKLAEHEHFSKIPALVLSTSENEASKLRCGELGAKGYLIKPFTLEEFEKIPEKVVEKLHHL